jgi:hypothetical protein
MPISQNMITQELRVKDKIIFFKYLRTDGGKVPAQLSYHSGHAMAQTFSHRSLTAAAQVCARVSSCGIYGRQSGSGKGFSLEFFNLPLSIIPCS